MTSLADKSAPDTSRNLRSTLASTPEIWGATAIAFMWLAVLFASIYGGDFVSVNGGGTNSTTVPSGIFVALFAWLASMAVAKRAFRREPGSGSRTGSSER